MGGGRGGTSGSVCASNGKIRLSTETTLSNEGRNDSRMWRIDKRCVRL
jgi:hypothetical protein